MKRTRRFLAALLALMLVLSGCGAPSPAKTETTPHVTDVQATEPPATEPPATEPEERPASLGRFEGRTYINEYLGFCVEFDEAWTFKTAEELQQIPENIAEILKDTELGETTASLTQIMDMQAENVDQLCSVNILYQALSMPDRLMYLTMSDEELMDLMLEESDMLVESYTQIGLEVESLDKVQVTFCGETRYAMKCVCDMSGMKYYTLQIFDYNLGRYGAVTTFSCFYEDITADLAAMCRSIA